MNARVGTQAKLFDTARHLDNGLVYRPDFISPAEEEEILDYIQFLPLEYAHFREYTAKRRIMGFGWGYDSRTGQLVPGPPLPPFLQGLQRKIAKWLDVPTGHIVEALITEYPPGTAIGWHTDRERFARIVGISLSGWCRMRFRPLSAMNDRSRMVALDLEPRSCYIMQKEVRWRWQHSIAPTKTLRYSITFRTLG